MLVENYHQFPSSLNFGSSTQFFAPARGQFLNPKSCASTRSSSGHPGVVSRFCRRLAGAAGAQPAPGRANLPGWRWGVIMQIPLVAVSRPLHSGVCETRQDAGLPVIHSAISDSGRLRTRGGQLSRKHTPCLVHRMGFLETCDAFRFLENDCTFQNQKLGSIHSF